MFILHGAVKLLLKVCLCRILRVFEVFFFMGKVEFCKLKKGNQ